MFWPMSMTYRVVVPATLFDLHTPASCAAAKEKNQFRYVTWKHTGILWVPGCLSWLLV